MKRLVAVLILFVPAAFGAASDPVTGFWKGHYRSRAMAPSMQNPIALEIQLKGDRIEGTVVAGEEKLPIENGRFWEKEKKIHFEVLFPGDNLRYIADGIVGSDEIKGDWKHEKGEGTFELRREPKPAAARSQLLHSSQVWRISSESVGRDLRFTVYLPPSYDESREFRYPVLYFLHGLREDDVSWEHRGVAALVDELRSEGKIGEFIVVAPRGENLFWLDGKNEGDRFETAIIQELIPAVERLFRVDQTRKPAILGVSMGGYGALLFALKHPDMFSVVAVVNAALFEEIPASTPREVVTNSIPELSRRLFGEPFDRQYYESNNPLWIVKRNPDQAKSLTMPIYIAHAREDQYGFLAGAAEFDRILKDQGVGHRFIVFPGTHEWRSIVPAVGEAVRFLWQALNGGQ